MLTFLQLVNICGGKPLNFQNDLPIRHLLTDSRKIIVSDSSIFFAIQGERHNGHKFLRDLYQKGIKQFVVDKDAKINKSDFPTANILEVKNSVHALQILAAYHRSLFQYPVLAITGSNGKTIVKEWLAQLLSKDYNIVRSPKSYNSQIGVPLSTWQMNSNHSFGIFEAGISQKNEMNYLQKVLKPTLGIFTNIGPAHSEGFGSVEEKVKEKLLLFKDADLLFYCKDHLPIAEEIEKTFKKGHPRLFSWSRWNNDADLKVEIILRESHETVLEFSSPHLSYHQKYSVFKVPFTDDASLENIIHCISVLIFLKLDAQEIQNRLKLVKPVSMRLEMKEGINSCTIIDDTYNNDLAGLKLAIDFLCSQKHQSKKTVIISDLLETGMQPEELYQYIADLLLAKEIDKVIGIGESISYYKHLFVGLQTKFYTTTQDFIDKTDKKNIQNELILIKGARKFEFERIVNILEQRVHGTVLEVNLDALSHNLNFYRNKLKPGTQIMCMVKSQAYGAGIIQVAQLLQFHRVDYLSVAYIDEGITLRENGITIPILVLNPSIFGFEKMIQYQLEPEIYSLTHLKNWIENIDVKKSKIHLAIDTGMHRLGFMEEDIDELLSILKSNPNLKIASIFSHLVGADDDQFNDFSISQIELFKEISNKIEYSIGYTTTKHILNSAGIVRFKNAQFDMVRLGIGLYGVEATQTEQEQLQTVGSLKTVISQIKYIKKGDTIGYSRKGKALNDMQIATLAIGYGDGYSRKFSNGVGKVMIKGRIAPIIGNVCMDMCMADITDIDAKEGDEVTIFNKELSIIDLANSIDTIPYEILTNISDRVKRIFYKE